MITNLKLIIAAGVFSLLSGCSFVSSNYGASYENVEAIKRLNPVKISVENFTASKSTNSISCRAAGPVVTPNKESFERYIQNAFISELKLAGAYSESSPITLKGNLTKIDFDSNIGNGKWFIEITASSNKSETFRVTSKYEFSTNWVADKACQQVAQALSPAVQDFIKNIINNTEFKNIIAKK